AFHAIDGSVLSGRMTGISDRNGNGVALSYDSAGRLSKVSDELNHSLTIAYDGAGMIASVTDNTGRMLKYAYYQNGDAVGSAGDLKSVTYHAVTGTPNGNDFPAGKTWTYKYSKGFADPHRNHNLVSITDAKGQIFLTNTYATTSAPTGLNYDRVMSQSW